MSKEMNTIKMLAIQITKSKKNNNIYKKFLLAIEKVKNQADDTLFFEIFDEILESNKFLFPFVKEEFIFSNCFPKKIGEMGSHPTLKSTYDLTKEIRWRVYLINRNSEEISLFVTMRIKYDKFILLGKYDEALKVLDEVEEKLGVSFWLLEGRVFLNNKLKNKKSEKISNEAVGINRIILEYYEMKNYDNMSCQEYQQIVDKEITHLNTMVNEYSFLKEMLPYIKYRISPFVYEFNEEEMIGVLKYSQSNSLIDIYLLCLELFHFILNLNKSNVLYTSAKKYIRILRHIQDEQLEVLQFCFDEENRDNYKLNFCMQRAKSLFINNELVKCREELITILQKEPFNVQAINLLTDTNNILGIEEQEFKGTILGGIIRDLMIVYPLKHERDTKMDSILKCLNCCSQSTWAIFIVNSILSKCKPINSEDELVSRKRANMQKLEMDTVCICLDAEEAKKICMKKENKDSYCKLKIALLSKDFDKARTICKMDRIVALLCVLDPNFELSQKKEIVDKYIQGNNYIDLLIKKCFLSKLSIDENLSIMLEFSTDMMIDNIFTSFFVPIEKLIGKIETMGTEINRNICVPILYFISYRFLKNQIKDEVAAACEDFLFFNHLNLPSNMEIIGNNKQSIYFLKNVCTTEILSTALASQIQNSIDLEQERLNICLRLCKMDPDNEKNYEKEIREITQKKKINSQLRIIQENRIHVNIDDMRQELIEKYKSDFLRFQLYEDNSIKEIVKAIEEKNGSVVVVQRDSERVLKELVENIRDAFVSSNEYGLDGYLSLNIRHGAISDVLRKPLSEAGLLANYNPSTRLYEVNTSLIRGIRNESDKMIIKDAIIDFTVKTEKIIDDLKNKYIRISTEKIQSDGIFDYNLTDNEYAIILKNCRKNEEFESFLEYLFEFFWNKTEYNLQRMKNLLQGEILNRYKESFSQLLTSIEKVEDNTKISGITSKIKEVSNNMKNVINKVCFWFQRSTESQNTDFDLEFVFNLGYETICSMHPEVTFVREKIEVSEGEEKIEGKYLRLYSDIFYNLLDNIYKNATRDDKCVKIEYQLKQENGKKIIYLQNDYDCSKSIDFEKSKLEGIKRDLESEDYLNKINEEGGTGIPKICKIITVDLKSKGNIDFGFMEKDNKFYIKIIME